MWHVLQIQIIQMRQMRQVHGQLPHVGESFVLRREEMGVTRMTKRVRSRVMIADVEQIISGHHFGESRR